MTPRMEKLQRQRALLHDHLRWLESEIAAEASAVPATKVEPPPVAPAPVPVASAVEANPSADPVAPMAPRAEVPEADVRGIHSEVRSGCLLYFILAFVGLGAVVGFIYWRY